MSKTAILNQKEQEAIIGALRRFLKENNVDQREFAKRIGKTETTLSRWMNGKHPITKNNATAISFHIGIHPEKKGISCNQNNSNEVLFYTFKARILNHIMQNPKICPQCKIETYKVISEFEMR